ncbi:hypothetical protein Mtc_1019 [Methanocella conradii HZ254]|uniref:Uncharacterized protein n=1 Tax=Methanocella conradii (strain DSM 24694 / JCM 17849 / CGMCC 1.5162 / HZ254) TaxID=1041930 RepID=H8I5V7_METCZ|nr:DUF6789 family protein [Methanocella conradii]AFC99774.1 hypothetical protein Mtc_1019 [Methanocella conradii HZ254]MDI6896510.1 hypothetical protein [Methanocella conradii]
MASKDIGNGAIAGIITGVIMGVLSILMALIGLASLLAFVDVRSVFGGMLPAVGFAAASLTAMITLLLFMAIIGLILGAIFGAIIESIPTGNSVTKGIVFLLAIWVVFGLLIPIILKAGGTLPTSLTTTGIVTALVAAIIWGGLLGVVFDWVSKKAGVPSMTKA